MITNDLQELGSKVPALGEVEHLLFDGVGRVLEFNAGSKIFKP